MDIITYAASVAYTKKAIAGGGSGGTTNYNALTNKPQINGVELSGNQTAQDLKINYVVDLGEVTSGQQITITEEQMQSFLSDNPPDIKMTLDGREIYIKRFAKTETDAYFSGSAISSSVIYSVTMSASGTTVIVNAQTLQQLPEASVEDAGKVPAVTTDGTGYELVPMSGGLGKEWKLLGETDCSQVGGNIIYDGLDNYTEFLVLAETVMNDSATASGYALLINDNQLADNSAIKINNQSLSTGFSQWLICKFDGLVWTLRATAGAVAQNNLRLNNANALYPYNFVLNVGAATTFEIQAPVAQYQAVSGKITVWGR